MKQVSKRTQGDYSLAFKLVIIDQVEKDELTYISILYTGTFNRFGLPS